MNREVEFNTELTKIHQKNYIRNSRAVTAAWFIFCACYTILNVVAFVQPFWVGDTDESPGVGYFGLYEYCERNQGSDFSCTGDFLDFNTISNNYFMASSFLVGGAALLFILSIICMILFLFLKPVIVLRLCGWLQLIAAIFMAVGCIIYPNAFDDPNFRRICGQDATAYDTDKCQIRWAYILGIVLVFDALILSILAFILASCQAKSIPEMKEKKDDDDFVNNAYEDVPSHDETTPRIIPQSIRYQTLQTPFQPMIRNQPINEPIIIPVDNFGDSSNDSDPLTPRRSDVSESVSLPKSETSPRSEKSVTSRSQTSDEPGDKMEPEIVDGSQHGETSRDIPL